jgi:hypothetical protein
LSGQTFYKDKPYVFVPLAESVARSAPKGHDSALSRACGVLHITIQAKTPLHFGQGLLEMDMQQSVIRALHVLGRESDGNEMRIALPGSSFKGMLRAFFEVVTDSCVLIPPRRLLEALPYGNRVVCRHKDGLCPACSVFGSLGYRGKLSFTSFLAEENAKTKERVLPQLQAPFRDYPRENRGMGNERLYYGDFQDLHGTEIGNLTKEEFFRRKRDKRGRQIQFYGRKFYKHARKQAEGRDVLGSSYECLTEGSLLKGEIRYQGLTEQELGSLMFALGMGWSVPIYHKLGYAKPAYFGSVKLSVEAEALPDRYRGMGLCHDTAGLKTLAETYRSRVSEDALLAIQRLEEAWSSLEGPFQWKHPAEGGQNLVY